MMDAKTSYKAVKAMGQANDFKEQVRKKAKSIGSSSEVSKDLEEDTKSSFSENRKRAGSGGEGLKKKLKGSFNSNKGGRTRSQGSFTSEGDLEKGNKNYKSIIYVFSARDSDMFIYENHNETQV